MKETYSLYASRLIVAAFTCLFVLLAAFSISSISHA